MIHLIMAISTLVMTAVPVFGEFIQKSLQDSGPYSVTLVNDQEELIELVRTGEIKAVVFDMELESEPITLVNQLKDYAPELLLILFNDKKNIVNTEAMDSESVISYEGVLRTSDLKNVLDRLIVKQDSQGQDLVEPEVVKVSVKSRAIKDRESSLPNKAIDWLNEVNDLARILARLTLESAAHAALVAKRNELWSYAGHLSRSAAEELAQSLWKSWSRGGGNDLAQFILLEATHQEYILYATGLGGDYVLGLAFEAAIPFSEMRMQANVLANKLTSSTVESPSVSEDAPVLTVDQVIKSEDMRKKEDIRTKEIEKTQETEDELADINKRVSLKETVSGSTHDEIKRDAVLSKVVKKELSEYDEIVEPDLDKRTRQIETNKDKQIENVTALDEKADTEEKSQRSDPQKQGPEFESQVIGQGREAKPAATEEAEGRTSAESSIRVESSKHSFDTITPPKGKSDQLEERSDVVPETGFSYLDKNELTYGCFLLPRLPHHYLIGDLGLLLDKWIRLHSVSFGWRLEKLVIKRDYLYWIGSLSSDLAPGKMAEILREKSSKYIFEEFPRLERENPSGDFWAPGCLIINGNEELLDQYLNEYKNNTRSRQGIDKSYWDNIKENPF